MGGGNAAAKPAKRARKELHPNDNLRAETVIKNELLAAGVDALQVEKWVQYCIRTYSSHVKLIDCHGLSEGQLAAAISSSPLDSVRGLAGSSYVGILCDPKLSGEAVTAPHIRVPPFRSDQFSTLLGAATAARGTTGFVAAGDIFFLPDGGKHGFELLRFCIPACKNRGRRKTKFASAKRLSRTDRVQASGWRRHPDRRSRLRCTFRAGGAEF